MIANSQTCNVIKLFCRNLVYLFSESKGRLISPQNPFLFLSKGFKKQPFNWIIRFTLVIIINNEWLSKYAYAAITIFIWDTENISKIFHLQVRDAAK